MHKLITLQCYVFSFITFQGRCKGHVPQVQILSISCSFWENLANLCVGAPPGLVPPPRGNPGSATASTYIGAGDKSVSEELLDAISGGSKGGTKDAPPGAQILSISYSFWENLAKLYVGPLLGEILDPPLAIYVEPTCQSAMSTGQNKGDIDRDFQSREIFAP